MRRSEPGKRNPRPTFFDSAGDFRTWLEQHGATASEVPVGFYRKASHRGLTYREALDAALACGWIDGVRRRVSEEAYTIRFTPRRPGSVWSAANIQRVRQLTSQGLMRPAGLRAYRDRDERKAAQRAYEREHSRLDAALEQRLRADGKAFRFFDAQPAGYKKTVIFWVMSAKQEETRARRLAHLLERSARGARIDLLSPNRT